MQSREYPNYSSYLAHQKKKTRRVLEFHVGELASATSLFVEEFRFLSEYLSEGDKVVCLGARSGAEVVAFNHLGFHAIGVDLIPNLPLVVEGDFHHTSFGDSSFSLVYSNALDHVFDLPQFCSEVTRLLSSGGLIHFIVPINAFATFESIRIESIDEVIAMFPGFVLISEWKCAKVGLRRAKPRSDTYWHSLLLREKE